MSRILSTVGGGGAWGLACMVGGMHGRGAWVVEGMRGRGACVADTTRYGQ